MRRQHPLIVVVRPGARTQSIMAWLRQLVPAALLVVAAPSLPPPASQDVVVIDDDDGASGPLSLAAALVRQRGASDPAGVSHGAK